MEQSYNQGRLDAVVEVLLSVRAIGYKETLKNMANEIIKIDANHPHAWWVLANVVQENTKEETK